MKRILIVDDDLYIGDMLEEVLTKEGYSVLRAYSGTEALLAVSAQTPDLVLLDLMLPGLQGEEVLPRLSGVPVIVLSAKAELDHKVELLLGGAADYVTKPFEVKELLARIQVQLRQSFPKGVDRPLSANGLTLDPNTRQAAAGETVIRLTRTECAILKLLLSNPKQVIAKSVMLDRISLDTPDCCTEHSLKQHISNLRKKLRDIGSPVTVEAVWGIGFRLARETPAES